jgi:hypothetical protein
MRLHRLELIDAMGLTGIGIKKIAETQEFTLEYLLLSGCHLLHSSELLPLKSLTKLTFFSIDHAHHLGKTEENFMFHMLPKGGIEFDLDDPEVIEVDDDDDAKGGNGANGVAEGGDDAMDEDRDAVVAPNIAAFPNGPRNNVQVFGINPAPGPANFPPAPAAIPLPFNQAALRTPLFDIVGRMQFDIPGLQNVGNLFPPLPPLPPLAGPAGAIRSRQVDDAPALRTRNSAANPQSPIPPARRSNYVFIDLADLEDSPRRRVPTRQQDEPRRTLQVQLVDDDDDDNDEDDDDDEDDAKEDGEDEDGADDFMDPEDL